MQRLSLVTYPLSALTVKDKWLFVHLKRLTCNHVQLHSSIHSDHPLWTYISFAVSFRCNWLITRLYTLKSLCAIASTVFPHSIFLLPSATKVGANVVFTRRLLPLTASLFLFYAPTVL